MQDQLYRMYDKDDQLLYIGISGQTLRRFVTHRLSHYWGNDVVTIKIERYETQLETQIAEIEAILAEKPKHNSPHPKAELMLSNMKARLAKAKTKPRTITELNKLVPDDEERTEATGYNRFGKPKSES